MRLGKSLSTLRPLALSILALAPLPLHAASALTNVLPSKPGFYVATESPCKDPANAVLRQVSERGIESARVFGCHITAIEQSGSTYALTQSCDGADGDKGHAEIDHRTIRIDGKDRFTDLNGGSESTFRFCSVGMP